MTVAWGPNTVVGEGSYRQGGQASLNMGSAESKADKQASKSEKKALKSAAKLAKKSDAGVEPIAPVSGPTPAERSAAAAEKSVAVNQRRFKVQIIAAVLAATAVLLTWLMRPIDRPATGLTQPDPASTSGDTR